MRVTSGQFKQKNLNNLEQYSPLQYLETHGLKHLEGESLLHELITLARAPNLPELTAPEVEALHRLLTKIDTAQTLLVRFESRVTRMYGLQKERACGLRNLIYSFTKTWHHRQASYFVWQNHRQESRDISSPVPGRWESVFENGTESLLSELFVRTFAKLC